VTRNEVEEIKRHFDEFGGGLRDELKQHVAEQVGGLRDELKQHVAEQVGGLRDELKQHVAEQVGSLRDEVKLDMAEQVGGLRKEMNELKQHVDETVAALGNSLGEEIAEVRRHAGAVAEDLRSEIRAVGDGVALANERIDHVDLRVDALTGEVRRGFAGVRAEVHRLHETDDELRRRIEAQERRGA
jgi:ElaB/YqjD/DUF883 family membrane-anchored ribosome-binding protein